MGRWLASFSFVHAVGIRLAQTLPAQPAPPRTPYFATRARSVTWRSLAVGLCTDAYDNSFVRTRHRRRLGG